MASLSTSYWVVFTLESEQGTHLIAEGQGHWGRTECCIHNTHFKINHQGLNYRCLHKLSSFYFRFLSLVLPPNPHEALDSLT